MTSSDNPAAALRVGQTVGNFRVIKLLGQGGMGAVFLAQHPGMGRLVAIKVLHARGAQHQGAVPRFINEARAANAIRHRGIVEIFDFGTLPSGAPYIVMEYLDGESLRALIAKQAPLALERAVEIASEAAAVLGAAHERGIVHRDLKPDNMFLVADPFGRLCLKVLDFGVAKLVYDADSSDSLKTETGVLVGTPSYMSPEQCRGVREIDQRTDVYALGVILYEMCCGRRPFVAFGSGEVIHNHIATAPPRPHLFNPRIGPALEGVILSALVKDPRQRVPTMDLFREALASVDLEKDVGSRTSETVDARAGAPDATRREPRWVRRARGRLESFGSRRLIGVATAIGVALFVVVAGARLASRRARMEPTRAVASERAPERALAAIQISSDPPGARVLRARDGADVGTTPLRASWPVADDVEKLSVELPGHRPVSITVARDRDVSVSLRLEEIIEVAKPEPAPTPARKLTTRPARRTRRLEPMAF